MNTNMRPDIISAIEDAVELHCADTVSLLQQLVRIPSVNHPPTGDEKEVQEFYARRLTELGLATELFEVDEMPAFQNHPGRLETHDMAGRPCVAGTLKGSGNGRSLVLIAHADVEVPGDESLWADGKPFSGTFRDGKVFGRGAGDDKSGMAIGAMVPRILQSAGILLKGDLIIASVPDEEQGGSNGTVGLLAKGYRADAALYLDGAQATISTSNLGGGYGTVDLRVPPAQKDTARLLEYFDRLRHSIAEFKKVRAGEFASHPHYNADMYKEFVVRLSDIHLGVDVLSHGTFKAWFYLLPGEDPEALQKRFEATLQSAGDQGEECGLEWMPRFVLSAEVDESHPFVKTMIAAYSRATQRVPEVKGSWMNDGGFVNQYGKFPCLLFGPARSFGETGSPHQPDEYVEVEMVMECLKSTVLCAMEWCGYEL